MVNLSDKRNALERNYRTIRENIRRAALDAGKKPEEICLLAATKTVDPETINYAIELGVRCVGENRVQEMLDKYDRLDREHTDCHFIGHLQVNKVKYIVDKVSMIHSVDNGRLAAEINRQCEKTGRKMDVLVEVNVGEEESKSGAGLEEVEDLIREISRLPHIRVRGLMVIPPFTSDQSLTKAYFLQIYKLFIDMRGKKIDNVTMDFLSMGMSDDYELAIASGANIVRVGSALFGRRDNL